MAKLALEIMNKLLGREVFVVASDESSHDYVAVKREFHIYDSMEDLRDGMKELNVDDAADLRVVHGVLTSAKALPSDTRGKTAFVVAMDDTDSRDGFLIEAGDTTEHIEDTVEDLTSRGIAHLFSLDIDSIFVLYGHEIRIVLFVEDEDMDEEIIEAAHQIFEEVNGVYERNKEEIEMEANE